MIARCDNLTKQIQTESVGLRNWVTCVELSIMDFSLWTCGTRKGKVILLGGQM